MIRTRGEDPSNYLKEWIEGKKRSLTREEKLEAYARSIWGMLRHEMIDDIKDTPDVRFTPDGILFT